MKRQFLFLLASALISFLSCDNKFIAINCKDKIIKRLEPNGMWIFTENSLKCIQTNEDLINTCTKAFNKLSFTGVKQISLSTNSSFCKSHQCNDLLDYKVYKCLYDKSSRALDVPSGCTFGHTLKDSNFCPTIKLWKRNVTDICLNTSGSNLEIYQWTGIFQCNKSNKKEERTFAAIQYVCCPKLNLYEIYMSPSNDKVTIKMEIKAYTAAKKELRKSFQKRQKEIQDRFIQEESSINIWDKYPKLAKYLEKKMQNKFTKKFTFEMNREEQLLRELEIIHGNKMQKLLEENRKKAEDRLKYTLQETNPQVNRIADAVKMELNSIIKEAEDVINFYETLIKEGLDDNGPNKQLIQSNFHSLMNQSWNNILTLLNEVPSLKGQVLKTISSWDEKRVAIIKRFNDLENNPGSRNSMKKQTENHVKNIISLYRHDTVDEHSTDSKNESNFSIASRILIIFLLTLSMLLLIALSLLLYRFHGKINSYLSSTFKKIHPPNKSLLVHIDNYPFKNRYNYGNGVYQPYFKSEESIIGNPNMVYNQHFSSAHDSSNEGLKDSVESNYNESPISNINGLENPICRLLDEK